MSCLLLHASYHMNSKSVLLVRPYASSLKCFHLNTWSASNKFSDLELLFLEIGASFDIIRLIETWYTDTYLGYNFTTVVS